MAISQIPQILTLSGLAFGSIFLLFTCRRSRIRKSALDSEFEQTLNRRLEALREEFLNPPTLSQLPEEIRLILDREREPEQLCLPAPSRTSKPIDHAPLAIPRPDRSALEP
jgi:hypothetical protein